MEPEYSSNAHFTVSRISVYISFVLEPLLNLHLICSRLFQRNISLTRI